MMRTFRNLALPLLLLPLMGGNSFAQQNEAPEAFHWADFHDAKDADIVRWVLRALDGQKWSAVREIGVEYDAALVLTTERATPQSSPKNDHFTLWSVSLAKYEAYPLIRGANFHLLDWEKFRPYSDPELTAIYDDRAASDCADCKPTTYFTGFAYDSKAHLWRSRWMRGPQAAPIWTEETPSGIDQKQAYALISTESGASAMATWNHLDYGGRKAAEDYIYLYDLDSNSTLDRMQLLSGKHADEMKQRICTTDSSLARGQNSSLCAPYAKEGPRKTPITNGIVTTPPMHNQGRSTPPH